MKKRFKIVWVLILVIVVFIPSCSIRNYYRTKAKKRLEGLSQQIGYHISTQANDLLEHRVNPWIFFDTGKSVTITNFYGKIISYNGVEFSGTPRQVFWDGFISPFLEALIVSDFQWAHQFSKDNNLPQKEVFLLTHDHLDETIARVYFTMQSIDQRLRGHGFPDKVAKRSIDHEIETMRLFLNKQYDSSMTLHLGSPFSRFLKARWDFLLSSAIGIIGWFAPFQRNKKPKTAKRHKIHHS